MEIIPAPLEAYAKAHSEPPGPGFEALREETYASTGSPGMQVGALEGAFLRLLVRLTSARRVLEIGMFTGYSGLMMAEGLPPDGELITCEIDPKVEEIARRHFARSPHGGKIRIRMGPALETLNALQGPFDLVFIDADKESYGAYWDQALPKVRQGGLLVADNTLWSGRVLSPRTQTDQAIVAFNAKVAADPRVEKVLLTVRDGMTLAWKR